MAGFADDVEGTCIMCPRRGTKFCPTCKVARYCSKDCQKLDWRNHKPICSTFNYRRPVAGANRILRFTGGHSEAKFAWASMGESEISEKARREKTQERPTVVMHTNTPEWNRIGAGQNKLQGRLTMRDPDEKMFCMPGGQVAGAAHSDAPNIGFRNFTRGQACSDDFKGPLVVMKVFTRKDGTITYGDMDMRDARTAADQFNHACQEGRDHQHLRDLRTLATIIACDGRVAEGKPKWDEVVLDGADSIWSMTGSSVANLLGLPILVRSLNCPWDVPIDAGHANKEITMLYRDLHSRTILPRVPDRMVPVMEFTQNPDHVAQQAALDNRRFLAGVTGFGSTMQMFDLGNNGTCYAVRADGKPFLKEHAEALCSFITHQVELQLVSAIAGLSSNESVTERDKILNSVTKQNFLAYFEAMKRAKVAGGYAHWADLPDPYKVKQADMQEHIDAVWEAQVAQGFEQESEKHIRQELVSMGFGSFTAADQEQAENGYIKGY